MRTEIDYDILPEIETIEDAAMHAVEMTNLYGHYYTPGILEAFNNLNISEAQFGLIEKYSSSMLSKKFETMLGEKEPEGLPEILEKVFWTPIHGYAGQILKPQSGTPKEIQANRTFNAVMLYTVIDVNISNMRTMMRAGIVDNEIDQANTFGRKDTRELYTTMPAERTLHVLKNGFLPKLQKAICKEFKFKDVQFKAMLQTLKQRLLDSSELTDNMNFLKPINMVEWMRFGKMPPRWTEIEAMQAKEDFGLDTNPPENT